MVYRAYGARLSEPYRSDHEQSWPHRVGALRRNPIPAFPESRLRWRARRLSVLTSLTSAVQDRIAHGKTRSLGHVSPDRLQLFPQL